MTATQRRIVQAAGLIAALTLVARLFGFLRTIVFARTVGPTCLGSTYQTANSVPNILYEVVAGGALAALVVPLIAGHAERGEHPRVARIGSALLTWAILVLTPLALAVVVFATPIMQFLLGDTQCEGALESGALMLRVFAPQVVLYGIGVVLTGVLQAYRRFAGPALAPLLSSLVVIGAYLTFAVVAGPGAELGSVTLGEELILSVGTTLGVLVLTLSLVVPAARSPFRYRPTLRLGEGIAGKARTLAVWGAVALGAQQLAVVATLRLGNDNAPPGTVVIYNLAYAVFLLPWAVLAVPVATSSFPTLSAFWDARDRAGFARTAAANLRVVLLIGSLSGAFLYAAARPTAAVVIEGASGPSATDLLARTIALLGPGLVGLCLIALLQRTLNAAHRARAAGLGIALGYAVMIVLAVVLSRTLDPAYRAEALAVATSVGVGVGGLLLVLASWRRLGAASVAGAPRTAVVAVLGGVLAGLAGRAVSDLFGELPPIQSVVQAVAAAAVALIVFLAVAVVFDRESLLRAARRG